MIPDFNFITDSAGYRRHRSQRTASGAELIVQVSPNCDPIVYVMIGVYGGHSSVTAHGEGATVGSAYECAVNILRATVSDTVFGVFCELVDVPAEQVAA